MNINTASLVSEFNDTLKCPILKHPIKIPLCGPDRYTYGKYYTTKWLQEDSSSPMTRAHMDLFQCVEDYTMKKLINTMDDFNLKDSLVKRICLHLKSTNNTKMIARL